MIQYQVILCDIPSPEVVTRNEDDSYTVFINKNLTYENQQEAFLHALHHIYREDFYKEDACQIEYEAHNERVLQYNLAFTNKH